MSNQYLKLRRSSVPNKIPDTGSLDFGELAINTYDGLVFMKKSGSSGEQVISIGSGGAIDTGSFATTGSNRFNGNQTITGSLTIKSTSTESIINTINLSGSNVFQVTNAGRFIVSRSIGDSGQTVNVYGNQDGSDGMYFQNDSNGGNAGIQLLMGNNRVSTGGSGYFQIYKGSSNNGIIADGTLIAEYGLGGIRMASLGNGTPATAGPISFAIGGYDTSNEIAWFNHPSYLSDFTAKNNINILSGSLRVFNGNINVTGSIIATRGFTGSLQGTSSFATNAVTASYADNFTVAGTITAQKLVVQTITSSVLYSSGSNIFGNNLSNTQAFTGSVFITGSNFLFNNNRVIDSSLTSSMSVLSSSFASTASFITSTGTNAFVQGGNSFGTQALLGTNDNNNLAFETSGSVRMFISSSGIVSVANNLMLSNGGFIYGDTNNPYIQLNNTAGSKLGYGPTNYIDVGGPTTIVNAGVNVIRFRNTRIVSTADTIIGAPNVETTPLARLQVRGSGATSASIALLVENLNTSASLAVLDNSNIGIRTSTPFSDIPTIGTGSIDLGNINSSIHAGGYAVLGKTSFNGYGAVGSNYYLDNSNAIRRRTGDRVSAITFNVGGFDFQSAGTGGVGSVASLSTLASLNNSGNFTIGNSNTSLGARIGIKGSGATSSSIALSVINSNLSSSLIVLDNGFVGIGTTSPLYTLDVSGSGRFTNDVNITGSAIASTSIRGGSTTISGNQINFGSSAGIIALSSTQLQIGTSAATTSILFMQNSTTSASLLLGGTSNLFPLIKRNGSGIDFRLADDSNFTSIKSSLFNAEFVGSQVAINVFNTDRQIGTGGAGHIGFKSSIFTFNNSNLNVGNISSAIVQIDSTTKGFLPPRTNLISNITTPAQGLITYLTGSANEGLYLYNSGSIVGWQKVLTNTGSISITGDITGSNALFTGTITAQKLVVQQVTSSIVYSSGSNIFGSQLTDIQSFTGSLRVTGSGNHWIMGSNVGIGTTTPNAKLDVNGSVIITGSLSQGISNIISGSYSHAEGAFTTAAGNYSHTEGNLTTTVSDYSHAEGVGNIALGYSSHAEGGIYIDYNIAIDPTTATYIETDYFSTSPVSISLNQIIISGDSTGQGIPLTLNYLYFEDGSSAFQVNTTVYPIIPVIISESYNAGLDQTTFNLSPGFQSQYFNILGNPSISSGNNSHAEGGSTLASGSWSHAEGSATTAIGGYSHAEGTNTISFGEASHAEGAGTTSIGGYSHTEGAGTTSIGYVSHAEGTNTISFGEASHAEGAGTTSIGYTSHAEGGNAKAIGQASHAEGSYTTSIGAFSHTEGSSTLASGSYSHAEGESTTAIGGSSHAEGQQTTAKGDYSHAEGGSTLASGSYSHAEGYFTISLGSYSHAGGLNTRAIGLYSHTEGYVTTAIGEASHVEGAGTMAVGNYSHAEGGSTIASGSYSHAEGLNATAKGNYSHAEGDNTTAIGIASHAEGRWTIANGDYQHVQGAFNRSNTNPSAFILGNGTSNINRSNLIYASGSSVQITGSLNISGSISITRDITGSNALFTGTITAQKLVVQQVTSSIIYSSGSNIFGSQLTDVQSFTGSLRVTGSGNHYIVGGNVGIGTTTPTVKLEVAGNTTVGAVLNIGGATGNVGELNFFNNVVKIARTSTSGLDFYTSGGQPGISLTSTSLVGIRTTTPSASLHIKGATSSSLSSSLLVQNSNASASLSVLDNGNVGIGVSASAYPLEIRTGTVGLVVGNSGGNGSMYVGANTSAAVWSGWASTGPFINSGDGNRSIHLQSTGNAAANVNIGTTFESGYKLQVTGSAPSGSLNVNNTLYVSGSNVGIRTTSPNASLHVAGTTLLSSSFNTAISGSTLKVQGSGSTQPIFTVVGSQGELFSITDSLSGSLFSVNDISGLPILEVFSDNTIIMGDYQAPALYATDRIASTALGSNVIYSLPTSSYDGVFMDYTVKSGSNARAGNFAAIWSGTAVNYMDNSTTDFGSTTGMVLSGSISGSNLVIFASGSTAGWTFKGIIKSI